MQKTPKDNGILSPQTSKKQILNYNSQKIHQFSSPPLPSKTYKSDDIQTTVFKKRGQSSTHQKTNGWTGHLNHKIRVILFNWMSLVTFQKGLQRETYALATSYMDEYVLLKPQIKRQQLQLGGFACISLASKVEQSRSIIYCSKDQIDTLFSLAQIQNQQGCILKKLGYRLNPDTYIYWLNMLMAQWDYYATKVESIYNGFRYTTTDKKSFFLSRQVYQMGDLFNCTLKSLQHNKQQISVNLFYISTKKNALKLKRDDNPQILSAKILQKDQFLDFYSTFYSTMFKSVFEPDQKLIIRLCKLFGLQVHMANPLINYTNPEQVLNIPKRFNSIYTYNPNSRQFLITNFNEQ